MSLWMCAYYEGENYFVKGRFFKFPVDTGSGIRRMGHIKTTPTEATWKPRISSCSNPVLKVM